MSLDVKNGSVIQFLRCRIPNMYMNLLFLIYPPRSNHHLLPVPRKAGANIKPFSLYGKTKEPIFFMFFSKKNKFLIIR